MMRLRHVDAVHTNKASSLESTTFDTKEYLNTRDKVRKKLTTLTTTKAYERIKNTRTGYNSPLPIELDDVPESCVPLYADSEQRELFLELTRYADNPKMTVKDILVPFSHTLLMEQKYKSSDLVLNKLSRPTKMKFIVEFLTKLDRISRKTYQVNILCNDHSMEYLLYETVKWLDLDCKRFRDHYPRDDQYLYGVMVQSRDPDRVSSRPYVNLLIAYDCCVPPDIRTQQVFMNTTSSPLFVIYLTLVNTAEIRLFNYIHLHPEEVIKWSTPIVDLSDEAKRCLLADFDYKPIESDRQWNEYMSKKVYKWALIDQKTAFRETRTRPSSFISRDQYQIRPKRRQPGVDDGLNDTAPEIMDILTQVLYGSLGSSKSSGRTSPIPKGPRYMYSPPRGYDSRDGSMDSNRWTLNNRPFSRVSKIEEEMPMDIDENNSRVSPSPSISSTSSSVYEDAPSSLPKWKTNTAPASVSLEKSIHSKGYKRKSASERDESPKRQTVRNTITQHDATYTPKSSTVGDNRGQFLTFSLASITPEPVYQPYVSNFRSKGKGNKRPKEEISNESSPSNSPKTRRLTSPPPSSSSIDLAAMAEQQNKSSSRDPRLSPNRDPRLSVSPGVDSRNAFSPPPVKNAGSNSRDPRRQIPHVSSSKPAEAQKIAEEEENAAEKKRRIEEDKQKRLEETRKKKEEEFKKRAEELRKQKMEEAIRKQKEQEEVQKQKEEELRKQKEEVLRKQKMEQTLRKQIAEQRAEAALLKYKEEEMARKQKEEEVRKQKAEEAARKQKEEEIRKQKEEQEIQKQRAEEELRKQRAEALLKQKEEEEAARKRKEEETARKQKEEEVRKQKEEAIQKQKEAELRKKMEEELMKQQEEEIRKQKEEEIRKEIEEEIRKKKEDEIRKRIEEEVRKKILEEMRKEEEDKKKANEEEKKTNEEKEGEGTDTLFTNDDAMSDFEKALEKIHLELQAALQE